MIDGSSAHGDIDPLIAQAEKILSQRLARNQVIDSDLLGEPAWDLLLLVFVETGRGIVCRPDLAAEKLGLSAGVARRWIAILVARGMLFVEGDVLRLTDETEGKLCRMFSAQLRELMQEFRHFEPNAQSSS